MLLLYVRAKKNMTEAQKKLNDECIESHRRMIAYHRRAIIELSRKAIVEPVICNECIDFEFINESGRSSNG